MIHKSKIGKVKIYPYNFCNKKFSTKLQTILCLIFIVTLVKVLYYTYMSWFSALYNETNMYWLPNKVLVTKNKDGTYDLKIPVKVIESSKTLATKLEIRLKELLYNHTNVTYNKSKLKQWYDIEDVKKRNNYNFYPLAIDLGPYIYNISMGLNVDRLPVYNPTARLLNVSSKICPPINSSELRPQIDLNLVIVSKSSVSSFKQRQRLRNLVHNSKNITSFKIGLVFIVGLPSKNHSSKFKMDNFIITLTKRAANVLNYSKLNFEEILMNVSNEVRFYDDILLGDFVDTYYNLTLKAHIARLWASGFCQNKVPLFLFVDDDVLFNLTNVVKYILTIPPEDQQYLVAGYPRITPVIRPMFGKGTRYAVSTNEIPWLEYPTYMPGTFYILGHKVLPLLEIASLYTEPFRLEDVYLAFIIKKLNIKFTHLPKHIMPHHLIE